LKALHRNVKGFLFFKEFAKKIIFF